MVKFILKLAIKKNHTPKKTILEYGSDYPDILSLEGELKIFIDNKLFFNDPLFPVLEFFVAVDEWNNVTDKTEDMIFNSIETEDRPLLLFKYTKGHYLIYSSWQLFISNTKISRDEISAEVEKLKDSINQQLKLN